MQTRSLCSACCIIALLFVGLVFQPASCLDSEELDALQKLYDSNPTLMTSFGWTSNVSEACSSDTSWNLTITCVDDHVAEVCVLELQPLEQPRFVLLMHSI